MAAVEQSGEAGAKADARVEAVAAMEPGAREEDEPGGGVLTRVGVAAEAAVAAGEQAGAD